MHLLLSTPAFLNRGRKHRTRPEHLIVPWPPRKYQPGTLSECDTIYDREPPPLEVCGPRVNNEIIVVPASEVVSFGVEDGVRPEHEGAPLYDTNASYEDPLLCAMGLRV